MLEESGCGGEGGQKRGRQQSGPCGRFTSAPFARPPILVRRLTTFVMCTSNVCLDAGIQSLPRVADLGVLGQI